jgi:VRR-NUC domain-containing protein
MKEAELQRAVIECAHRYQWLVAHFRTALMQSGKWATPVQGDGKGFPDLVLVRRGRLLFVELKSKGRKTTPEQNTWLSALRLVESMTRSDPRSARPTISVHLWDPTDWGSGRIEDILR